jgi:urease accessory protein
MLGWYNLLQVVDSSFPTGAHAHSAGLESLPIADLGALQALLESRIDQSLGRLELVFLRHALATARDLVELDERLNTMLLARETREASGQVGTAFLRAVTDIYHDARLLGYLEARTPHHQPIVFGAVAAACAVPHQLAAPAYAFQSVRSVLSAAQRLGMLGPRDAQRMLHRLKPAVDAAVRLAERLSLDDAGAFSPLWDIAGMQHEHAPARMFAS